MADEEIQRAIEFIVQQQAQYEARLEKDKPRLAGLEESFKILVELARRAKERPDSGGHSIHTDESRVLSLEESFATLVELARRMDERREISAANDGNAAPPHE